MGSPSIRSLFLAFANLLLVVFAVLIIGNVILWVLFIYQQFTRTQTFEAGTLFFGTIGSFLVGAVSLLGRFILRQYSLTIAPPWNAPPAVQRATEALDSYNPDERKTAIQTLGEMHHKAAQRVLLMALKRHPVKSVRAEAATVLSLHPTEDVLDAVMESLSDASSEVREAAVKALAKFGDVRAVSPLVQTLADERSEVRFWAAIALGELKDTNAVPGLIKTMKDGNWSVRREAAWSLGKIGDARAVPALIEALPDKSQEVQTAIVHTLGLLGDSRAVPTLAELLCTEDYSAVTSQAIDSLRKIGRAAVPELMKAIMSCSKATGVEKMIRIVGDTGDPVATEALLDILRREQSQANRDTIINALRVIALNIEGVSILIDTLHDEATLIRVVAAYVLGLVQAVEAVPHLIDLLEDEAFVPPSSDWPAANRRVCDVAADALTKIGTPQSLAAVKVWSDEVSKP